MGMKLTFRTVRRTATPCRCLPSCPAVGIFIARRKHPSFSPQERLHLRSIKPIYRRVTLLPSTSLLLRCQRSVTTSAAPSRTTRTTTALCPCILYLLLPASFLARRLGGVALLGGRGVVRAVLGRAGGGVGLARSGGGLPYAGYVLVCVVLFV